MPDKLPVQHLVVQGKILCNRTSTAGQRGQHTEPLVSPSAWRSSLVSLSQHHTGDTRYALRLVVPNLGNSHTTAQSALLCNYTTSHNVKTAWTYTIAFLLCSMMAQTMLPTAPTRKVAGHRKTAMMKNTTLKASIKWLNAAIWLVSMVRA